MILNSSIKGLVLRNYTIKDADSYAKHANNYNIWRYFRDEFPYPYNYEDAKKYIEKTCIPNPQSYFAISFEEKFIGDIHIAKQTDILRLSGFLGYWLAEEYWGKGFMTEAVNVITKYTFKNTDLIRIFARVFQNNKGSIKVLQKAGYVEEGYFKKAIFKEGQHIDQLQFAVLKD